MEHFFSFAMTFAKHVKCEDKSSETWSILSTQTIKPFPLGLSLHFLKLILVPNLSQSSSRVIHLLWGETSILATELFVTFWFLHYDTTVGFTIPQ